MIYRLLALLCMLFWAEMLASESQALTKAPYTRPATCDAAIWDALRPYFLPENHPIRGKLDAIFSRSRVLASKKNLVRAGFTNPHARQENNAYVMKHPRMPGYVFKAYLDTQEIDDWYRLQRRILGAHLVQGTLDDYGFNHLIKVPKKWIYPLPPEPLAYTENGKHFILVAQDVGVLDKGGNAYAWRNAMTRELLTALYIVIAENKMTDSIRIHNIPFCYDGKVAFIDTEFFDVPEEAGRVRFWKLYDALSSEMADYLKGLEENGV